MPLIPSLEQPDASGHCGEYLAAERFRSIARKPEDQRRDALGRFGLAGFEISGLRASEYGLQALLAGDLHESVVASPIIRVSALGAMPFTRTPMPCKFRGCGLDEIRYRRLGAPVRQVVRRASQADPGSGADDASAEAGRRASTRPSSSTRANARIGAKVPLMLTRTTSSRSASRVSMNALGRMIAALLINTSAPPNARKAVLSNPSAPRQSATSL